MFKGFLDEKGEKYQEITSIITYFKINDPQTHPQKEKEDRFEKKSVITTNGLLLM